MASSPGLQTKKTLFLFSGLETEGFDSGRDDGDLEEGDQVPVAQARPQMDQAGFG